MSIASLRGLLNGDRPDHHPIARTRGQMATVRRLRADVAANLELLRGRRATRALLVCEDSYLFLVGLIALLQSGIEVVLPQNMQPGTLLVFKNSCDLMMTDRAGAGFEDAVIVAEGGSDAAPFALNVDHGPVDFFTSGSTGEMKRVRKTMAAFAREATALESLWGDQFRGAGVLGMVTHQHVYGLTFRIVWTLLSGRYFSATTHLVWEAILAEMAEIAAPVAIISSPAHLTRTEGVTPLVDGMRPAMIFTAGAPLPSAATEEVGRTFGVLPIEIFGSTETGVVAWRTGITDAPLWQPVPGVEIVPQDTGLLRVKSAFLEGEPWRDLADRITLIDDGRFRFEGRADRVVKIEGRRVSMLEVERAIKALPWIDDAAVAMITVGRQSLGAVAILSAEGRAELAALGNFRFARLLRRELGMTQDMMALPRRWRFVERMPVDNMGKRRIQDIAALLMEPA